MKEDNRISQLAKIKGTFEEDLFRQLTRVATASNFASNHLHDLVALLEANEYQKSLNFLDYKALCAEAFEDITQEGNYAKALRLFRRKHMLRILFRDLTNRNSTEQTLKELSTLADALLLHCIEFTHQLYVNRYGEPCYQGKPVSLCTIAMGKLGGGELNFSSDIDLIFAYAYDGHTNGENAISNQTFFTKQVQLFLKLFTAHSPEGIVFRVDIRLRPHGNSGPLVMSFQALETYYQEQGRGWERYAMVKARILSKDNKAKAALQKILTPFVYRRYVDFSVIDELRGMKALIEREVTLKKLHNDIKRGKGGIREIEFIAQAFQLTRGGRLKELRHSSLLATLDVLGSTQIMPNEKVIGLKKSYLFLRRLENCLQMLDDRQTHVLPAQEHVQRQIALAMGESDWQKVMNQHQKHQQEVVQQFRTILQVPGSVEDEDRILKTQITSLWQGVLEANTAENLLLSLGFKNAGQCYQILNDLRHGAKIKRLSQSARMRLDRFMVIFLMNLQEVENSDLVLLRMVQLLESIAGRSAYVALLVENQPVLMHLLVLFAKSPWVAEQLAAHPFLLEVLLDESNVAISFTEIQLKDELEHSLLQAEDAEHYLEILCQFKLKQTLQLACYELEGTLDCLDVARGLSHIASAILEKVFAFCVDQLIKRYPEMEIISQQFAIIAYGKLGSMEMNFDSDLDLVFLHCVEIQHEALMLRLTQKILHTLNAHSASGVLYKVDTRLRPSGAAGLLVSQFDAFKEYQCNKAWTWEHQAMVRARVIVGTKLFRKMFQSVRTQVLTQDRDKKTLEQEVLQMREKIREHRAKNDIKNRPGGLIDLEFLIQFLVLLHARQFENIDLPTESEKLLVFLCKKKEITKKESDLLKKILVNHHKLIHQQILSECYINSDSIDEDFKYLKEKYFYYK